MSMWCTSRLKREVFLFLNYISLKNLFLRPVCTVSPYCDLKADF